MNNFSLNPSLGTETEYALVYYPHGNESPPAKAYLFDLLRATIQQQTPLVRSGPALTGYRYFTANGGCFYLEQMPHHQDGGLIEFATPECTSPMQLLACKRAQVALLEKVLPQVRERLKAGGYRGRFALLKNSRDNVGNGYGEQENYEIPARSEARLWLYRLACVMLYASYIPVLALFILLVVAVFSFMIFYLVVAAVIDYRRQARFGGEAVFSDPMAPFLKGLLYLEIVFMSPLIFGMSVLSGFAFTGNHRRVLGAHLISRVIYTGSGCIDSTCQFVLSERALTLTSMQRTTGSANSRKPVFENHNFYKAFMLLYAFGFLGGAGQLFARRQRLQINYSDACMAQVADYLKIATTALLVRMVAAGELDHAPVVRRPLAAMALLNRDPDLMARVETSRGEMTALQIQRYYLAQAKLFVLRGKVVDASTRELLVLWEKVLDSLERDPGSLFGQVDWISKYHLIRASGKPMHHPSAKKIDLKYHQLEDGYFARLRQNNLVLELLEPSRIAEAIHKPPQSRAAWRVAVMKKYAAEGRNLRVGWSHVTVKKGVFSSKVINLDEYRD